MEDVTDSNTQGVTVEEPKRASRHFSARDILFVAIVWMSAVLIAYAIAVLSGTVPAGLGPSSSGWAGWAATGANVPYTSVQTTFVAPTFPECGATENSWTSFWAGLDGYGGGSTVEQSGIETHCHNGHIEYLPFIEVYPAPPRIAPLSAPVHAGDTITAEVDFAGADRYNLSVKDDTTNAGYSTTLSAPGAASSSAECIGEDPGLTAAPYSVYNPVEFSSCTANGAAIATLDPRPLSSFVDVNVITAHPSGLASGTSFYVLRNHTPSARQVSPPKVARPSPGKE